MEFFDEDSADLTATRTAPPRPPRTRGSRRPPRSPRQQIMFRRGIAAAVGLLIIVLLVLGIRGCLNAQHERDLRDYGKNVSDIVQQSNQISGSFFKQLQSPGSLGVTEYTNNVASYRSGLDSLLQRTDQLNVPGDMGSAQQAFKQVMQLRNNAMSKISDSISTALGSEGRQKAINTIADQMKAMLASDVVYRQIARPDMQEALSKNGINDVAIPDSKFLPDDSWLSSSRIESALSQVSGASSTATPGIHGLGLIQTSIAGSVLQAGVPATITGAGSRPELDVEVQNQGSVTESGVTVSVTVNGGQPTQQQISSIAAGSTATAKIPLTSVPRGQVTLNVEAQPVPGEKVTTNNKASYTVTFG